MTEYRLKLDLNAPHLAFHARTLQVLERSTLALNSIEGVDTHSGLVPGVSGPSIPIQLHPRPLDVVRPEAALWLVGCTLRDWLEELFLYLVEVRRSYALVLAFRGFDVPLRSEEFNEMQRETARFDGLGFPGKVEALREDFGAILGDGLPYVETLVKARNCLVHRLGIIAQRDCNDGGSLVVHWRTFEIFVQNPGEPEAPAGEGTIIQPGGGIIERHREVERRFALGQRLVLNTTDLCGIWWTLNSFCVGTSQRLFEVARTKGLCADEAAT